MIRGTTPALTLTIPNGKGLDLTQAEAVYVTLRKREKTVTLTGETLTVEPLAVTFRLSQEDSLAFAAGAAEVQLNWICRDAADGALYRGATEVQSIHIGEQLLEEVI